KRVNKAAEVDAELEEWKKAKQLLKPKDQVELSDAELKEVIAKVLESINPQTPDSLIEFSHAQGEFVPLPPPGNMVIEEKEPEIAEAAPTEEEGEGEQKDDDDVSYVSRADDKHDEEGEGEGEGEGDGEHKAAASKAPAKGGRPRKLTNSFNFSNVLQWVIYDGYIQDYAAQQLEKELERERREKDKAPVGRIKVVKRKTGRAQLSEAVQGRVFEYYRYWDDPSDEYREDEGTLLPLWKFTYDKVKKNTVTDMEWNPYYYDMFAVCFGFLDFMKPIAQGAVCLFTLKNPSYPDYICMTPSGVMCVDTHPKYPYMVVVGLYDGSILVYNVQATCKEPAYRSNNVTNKHRGIVWEVKWVPDMPDGELNFFSVAADGKINNWVLMQNDLAVTTIITLFLAGDASPGPDGTLLRVKGCASCVKMHPKNPIIYLVGTEEGFIYKCSTEYSSMYLLTYNAHQLPVYRIDFNRYNTDIFVSCSADWRIKIWEDDRLEPLFVFDVGDRVGDVKWAPYSSTVFAAVTAGGRVFVFDLNVNKYKPICIQPVVSKRRNKLTRITFNPKLPILIVGDDKGCVTTLKLSPNLRIPCKAPKKQQYLDQWTLQCMKLDKLLSLVREPVKLTLPEDTAGSEDS
ncbi:hypothetical protein NQ314_014176, partial [Rhamnusium bicolor]